MNIKNKLEPTDKDIINATIKNIKDNTKFTPNYVKYFDGKKWIEKRIDENNFHLFILIKNNFIYLP